MTPLAQCAALNARIWTVLQTAQPAERPLFGSHNKSSGLAVSGLSP